MRTLMFPSFVNEELICLLGLVGADIDCPMPDIIILNGGHHDVQVIYFLFTYEISMS